MKLNNNKTILFYFGITVIVTGVLANIIFIVLLYFEVDFIYKAKKISLILKMVFFSPLLGHIKGFFLGQENTKSEWFISLVSAFIGILIILVYAYIII